MSDSSLVKRFRNVSISRKLYFTVGIMALLIVIELMTLMFAIHTLSSVRTLVGAEGLWSKAQKDATYHLEKYGHNRDEKEYEAYLHVIQVPLGDHITRVELMKPNPDFQAARQGFIQGRVHPKDIDGALHLLTRFHNVDYIRRAVAYWIKRGYDDRGAAARGGAASCRNNRPSPLAGTDRADIKAAGSAER